MHKHMAVPTLDCLLKFVRVCQRTNQANRKLEPTGRTRNTFLAESFGGHA